MRTMARRLPVFLAMTLWMPGLVTQTVRADVGPGDIIDKSNYEKIEGWVPDYVVGWVKAGDLTMKPFHVVTVFDEAVCQPIQKLWIARRISRRELVWWIDNPNVEVARPNSIDERAGEPRIVFVSHPMHDRFARVVTCL